MKNLIIFFAVAAMFGCGDNKTAPDAKRDGRSDAYCSSCPPAPSYGAQIDRMGRPAINTALNSGFRVPSATVTAAKDAYNQNSSPSTWIAMFAPAFMRTLAIVDWLDTGICGNSICELTENMANCVTDCPTLTSVGVGNGCGNQALYNGRALGEPGNPMPTSYLSLAAVMANDELYLDTSKTMCQFYLAVEFGAVVGSYTTCGGRAPNYDVIDFTLSLGAMGTGGFIIPGFIPKLKDNAEPHTDLLPDFPYLGPPH